MFGVPMALRLLPLVCGLTTASPMSRKKSVVGCIATVVDLVGVGTVGGSLVGLLLLVLSGSYYGDY